MLQDVHAAFEGLRRSRGYRALSTTDRASLDRDLGRIETTLGLSGRDNDRGLRQSRDPFDVSLETPNDLRGGTSYPSSGAPGTPSKPAGSAPSDPARPPGTELIGDRAKRALDAVDFSSFVAGLIQGTFQAIVDATVQQVREYAKLVADLSKTVEDFTRDNVSGNQARDWLTERYPQDLALVLPSPGQPGEPRVVPRRGADPSPAWLGELGLEGAQLDEELTEGALLVAARRSVGEERMRLLANTVLLGINRIVVEDGQIRARLQFHAHAREQLTADITLQGGQQMLGIAARQGGAATQISTMVSTVDVNTQSDISIKADLTGEVMVKFRTETVNLDRFADAETIGRINRHALARKPAGSGQAAPAEPTSPPATPVANGPAQDSGGAR